MIININIEKAELLGISLLEYFFLECIRQGFKVDTMVSTSILQEKGYLDLECKNVSNTYIDFFNSKKDVYKTFEDVYNLYPLKANKRVLKSKSIHTSDGDYCFKKFRIYQRNNINIADNMYKGLKNEILLREKGNTQEYQQDIRTWFNQRTWEKYQDLELEENKERVKRI